jgi:hypothetical protein
MKRVSGYVVAALLGSLFSGSVAFAGTKYIQAQQGTATVQINGKSYSTSTLVYKGTTYAPFSPIVKGLKNIGIIAGATGSKLTINAPEVFTNVSTVANQQETSADYVTYNNELYFGGNFLNKQYGLGWDLTNQDHVTVTLPTSTTLSNDELRDRVSQEIDFYNKVVDQFNNIKFDPNNLSQLRDGLDTLKGQIVQDIQSIANWNVDSNNNTDVSLKNTEISLESYNLLGAQSLQNAILQDLNGNYNGASTSIQQANQCESAARALLPQVESLEKQEGWSN